MIHTQTTEQDQPKTKNTLTIRIGLFLCLSGLIIALNLFVFSLPKIGTGIWPQSETATAALHISAALCALGLLLLLKQKSAVLRILKHPLVLLPFSIGLLSLILSLFHDLPIRSFLGSTRTGEGIISWFDLSVLSASALLLWRLPRYRKIIILSALTGFILSFILSITHVLFEHIYTPYFFADYLSFHILALMPIAYLFLSKKMKPLAFFIAAYLILNILFLTTENKAMIAYGFTIPLCTALFWSFPYLHDTAKKHLELMSLITIPFIAIIAFLGIVYIGATSGFYNFTDTGLFRSIASRAFLMDTALNPMRGEPLTLLTGHGWGTYVEHVARHLPLEWLNLTDHSVAQWDGLTSDHFHPHNMFLETLSAAGLIGYSLFILYIINLYTSAKTSLKKPAFLMSAGFMTWASFWFFLPVNIPFLALAAASLGKSTMINIPTPKALISTIFLLIIALQITGAFMTQSTAQLTQDYDPQSLPIKNAQNFQSRCPIEYRDYSAGGLHLSRILLDRVRYTVRIAHEENKAGETKDIQSHIESLNHIFCQSTYYTQTHQASARLEIARLMTRGEILLGLTPYLNKETKRYYEQGWNKDLEHWLIKAPARSDQAIPYLLFNIITKQEQHSKNIINMIYTHNPQDPVGLWFTGLNHIEKPTQDGQAGIDLMKKALQNGIERFMPIDKNLLKILKSNEKR